MAREGEEFEIEARAVNIKRFDIHNIHLPHIDFEVECTKGTYIRSLARDFGEELGCGAHLTSLCRLQIGDYMIDDAITVEQLEALVIHDKLSS